MAAHRKSAALAMLEAETAAGSRLSADNLKLIERARHEGSLASDRSKMAQLRASGEDDRRDTSAYKRAELALGRQARLHATIKEKEQHTPHKGGPGMDHAWTTQDR